MVLETCMLGNTELSAALANILHFWRTESRDIIDECDEIFSPKYEVVYPIGQQRLVQFSPDRWTIVQEMLGLINKYAAEAKTELPMSMDLHEFQGSRFPRLRFLTEDGEEGLLGRMARTHLRLRSEQLPASHWS